MKSRSVKLAQLEKEYGPAQLGQDRPENTISVLRLSDGRRSSLVAMPGIRPDAALYLHFRKPIDLMSLVRQDVRNLRKSLGQPPESISGLSAYASTVSPSSPRPANPPLEGHKSQTQDLPRPKVDQIGYDLPQSGPIHPVISGHLPVKTGGSTNQRPHKSTNTLLEEALQRMPTLEAHELLFEREIGACRRHKSHQSLVKSSSSSPRRGPELDR